MSRSNKKVVIIVQARMGSTRLPGKVMIKVLGRPLLSFLLERLKRVKLAHKVIVATPDDGLQIPIIECCKENKVDYFLGSHEDVLDRYVLAAKAFDGDVIVRVTGDCPLNDPDIVDMAIREYLDLQPDCDYLSNTLIRTYPRGMDVEVFSVDALNLAGKSAEHPSDREHVTPYIHKHPEIFKMHSITRQSDESRYRWTVDTAEDLELMTKILEAIYPKKPEFTLDDLLHLLKSHPGWEKINAHIEQKLL